MAERNLQAEMDAWNEKRDLEAEMAAYQASKEPVREPELPPEAEAVRLQYGGANPSEMSTPREKFTAATQGGSYYWGDEIAAGLGAGIAKIAGDEKPFTEIYRDMQVSEEDRYDAYKREHPGEALALELAGGLVTPLPKPIALLNRTLGRTAKVAEKAAVKTAERLGGGEVFKNVTKNIGSGAFQGGLAGAGAADSDNILGGAALGATIGGGVGLGLRDRKSVV